MASDIGMGKFLVDSGWDTEAGEYDKWLAGSTGDYAPPPGKFPDLVQTFNFIRSANRLAIHLWVQPFAVGRESVRYPATAGRHIETAPAPGEFGWDGYTEWPVAMPTSEGNLENVNLCARLASTQDYLGQLVDELSSRYQPEGYWVDAIDFLPANCAASHIHDYAIFGDGLNASLERIKTTVLAHNPSAVVQFRGPYANLNTKPYANVWQTPDSPGKPYQMHMLALKMRPFSNGVVFASDQLYWPNTLSEADTARAAMTAVLVGVPAYGLNLLTASPTTLRILETWMDFYRKHRGDLATGRFDVFGSFRTPNHVIEAPGRSFAFIRHVDRAPLAAKNQSQIFIFNATASDHLTLNVDGDANRTYVMTTLDRFMAPQSDYLLNSDATGRVLIDVPVDQGATLVLEPRRKTVEKRTISLAP
jgi:hypothetical protein